LIVSKPHNARAILQQKTGVGSGVYNQLNIWLRRILLRFNNSENEPRN